MASDDEIATVSRGRFHSVLFDPRDVVEVVALVEFPFLVREFLVLFNRCKNSAATSSLAI